MTTSELLPISAVVATRDRAGTLERALNSLADQDALPAELIIVDASVDGRTRDIAEVFAGKVANAGCVVAFHLAAAVGAAAQRNQGAAASTKPYIWFFDDDVLFEPHCLRLLWEALRSDAHLGGVNAMIVNQRYQPPGTISRLLFGILSGQRAASYAGRIIGPAVNLLPEDRNDLPDVVPVEWLNTTCVLYRRDALPSPPFPAHFLGASLLEDVALSCAVGKTWRLANVRKARVFHDSQQGDHKRSIVAASRMELVNRHYVMTQVLKRRRLVDYAKLALWECFLLANAAIRVRGFLRELSGKLLGLGDMMLGEQGTR